MPAVLDKCKVHFDSLVENPFNLNGVLDALFEGVYFVDAQRQIQEWNSEAFEITGFSRDEVRGRCCADNILVHVDECGNELCKHNCPLQQTLIDGETRRAKVFLRHKRGYRVPVAVCTIAVRDNHARIVGAVETFREVNDAEQWKARISELQRAAYLDPLTEIPNRRFIEIQMVHLLREFRNTGELFAVLLVDVDGFKAVNDTHGHDVGDHVICNTAQTLTNSLRSHDLLGRWGGDEFIILLGSSDREQCLSLASRARVLVAQTATPTNSGYVRVTVSIGGAVSMPGDTAQLLVKRADEQLYASKHRGRNYCTVK